MYIYIGIQFSYAGVLEKVEEDSWSCDSQYHVKLDSFPILYYVISVCSLLSLIVMIAEMVYTAVSFIVDHCNVQLL